MYDAVAVGDAILDVVTPPLPPGVGDRQSHVERFSYIPGGNATNFALAFAALGGRTALAACIGRDWAGSVLRGAFRRGGVDAHLRLSPTKPTGMTFALTFSDGTRRLVTSLGANADLRPSDVPTSWIGRTRHVHRAGYWWATRLIGPPTKRLLQRARAAGATTSLDVSTDPLGWPQHRRDAVLSVLPHVDIFFGNEEEVRALAGVEEPTQAAKELCRRGVGAVVVHRGARGARYIAGSAMHEARAYRVPADNPTGCGDVFNAGFVRSRLLGRDIPEALRFANASAALHLRDRSRPYPYSRSVMDFLRSAASL